MIDITAFCLFIVKSSLVAIWEEKKAQSSWTAENHAKQFVKPIPALCICEIPAAFPPMECICVHWTKRGNEDECVCFLLVIALHLACVTEFLNATWKSDLIKYLFM